METHVYAEDGEVILFVHNGERGAAVHLSPDQASVLLGSLMHAALAARIQTMG